MKLQIVKATTSQRVGIFVQDSSATDGSGLAGLLFNTASLAWYYWREDEGNVNATVVNLATATRGTWATGGFIEKDATNLPGFYEISIPNLALATGADWVVMRLGGAANMAPLTLEIQLTDLDLNDVVRAGLTALPNAAADAAGGLPISDAGGLNLDAMNTNINDIETDTADMQPKLGAPAGASISADIAVIEAQTDDLGVAGAGLTAIPWNAAWDAEVESEVNDALLALGVERAIVLGTADSGTTTTVVDATRTEADTDYFKGDLIRFTSGTIIGQVRFITSFTPGSDTITFSPATTQAVGTNTYEIISAGRVDLELWRGTQPLNLTSQRVQSEIASVSATIISKLRSYRSGTHDAGGTTTTFSHTALAEADIDHWKGMLVLFTSNATDGQVRLITASTAAGAITYAPATTQLVDINTYEILTAGAVNVRRWLEAALAAPTVAGVPEVDMTHLGGVAQSATDLKDFADAGYDPVANKIEGVKLADTLSTYTGDTPQTGDNFARLGAPAGASVSADVAAIEGQTDDIGVAGAGLTAVPWNSSWDTEIQSEVNDALVALGLDHLVAVAVTGPDVIDNSVVAKIVSASATADFDDFVNTTDSLQALQADNVALQSDTDDIQTRLPATLDGANMRSSVQAMTAAVAQQIRDEILPTQNAAFNNMEFLFVAASDHVTPVTAASGTAVTRSIDGGAFGAGTGTLAEVANGIYQYDASAADMNGGIITFRFTATGGTPGAPDDTFVTIVTGGGV